MQVWSQGQWETYSESTLFSLLTDNERLLSPFAQHQITEIKYSASDQTFSHIFLASMTRK